MVQPRSIMNFGPVVKPFGSNLKKFVLGQVKLGVVMVHTWSNMNFGPVVKPFVSNLKKVVLGQVRLGVVMIRTWSNMNFRPVVHLEEGWIRLVQVRSSNITELVDNELWTCSEALWFHIEGCVRLGQDK